MNRQELVIKMVSLALVIISTGCTIPPAGKDTPPVAIGGVISGLEEGEQVELALFEELFAISPIPINPTPKETTVFSENGAYTFTEILQGIPPLTPLASAIYPKYQVRVNKNPPGKLCTVDDPEGYASTYDITTVHIKCGAALVPGLREAVTDETFATCINQTAYERGYNAVEDVYLISCSELGINEVTGLHIFTSLLTLTLTQNNISSIDLSNVPSLTSLSIFDNELQTIDVSELPNLRRLTASFNALSDIDVSANTALTTLNLTSNNLTTIDVSANTALVFLDLARNNLSTIDLSANPALKNLDLHNNNFTSIDLSQYTEMATIDLEYNQLTEVNLSNLVATTTLMLADNLLTNLDNVNLENLQLAPTDFIDLSLISLTGNPFDEATETFLDGYTRTTPFRNIFYDDNY